MVKRLGVIHDVTKHDGGRVLVLKDQETGEDIHRCPYYTDEQIRWATEVIESVAQDRGYEIVEGVIQW